MSAYKKFDEQLFRESDSPARIAVLTHLDSQGLFATENVDKYGPDLVLYSGYKPMSYIEVEIKRGWTGSDFPFPTVNLPVRKEKFLNLGLPIEFWILNGTLDSAIIIPDYTLDSSLIKEVRNNQIEDGEMFYQVPAELCILKKL